MDERFSRFMPGFTTNAPCSKEFLVQLQTSIQVELPADYLEFMLTTNGGEGSIGDTSYLLLWKVENIESWNDGYGVREFAPGLVLFGSDGGDTAYAFDARFQEVRIVEMPFIGMDLAEVHPIGTSFLRFIEDLFHR